MFSRRASQSTTLGLGVDDAAKSVLSDVLGIGLHQFPFVEHDAEVVKFLNGFAHYVNIQTGIAKREREQTSLLQAEYALEGVTPFY